MKISDMERVLRLVKKKDELEDDRLKINMCFDTMVWEANIKIDIDNHRSTVHRDYWTSYNIDIPENTKSSILKTILESIDQEIKIIDTELSKYDIEKE